MLGKAAEMFELVLKQKPKDVKTLLNLGMVQNQMHRKELAIKTFDRLLKFDPKNLSAYLHLGNCHFEERQFAKALEKYDIILEIDPEMMAALLNKISALKNLNRYEDTLPIYDKILHIKPKSLEYLVYRDETRKKVDEEKKKVSFPNLMAENCNQLLEMIMARLQTIDQEKRVYYRLQSIWIVHVSFNRDQLLDFILKRRLQLFAKEIFKKLQKFENKVFLEGETHDIAHQRKQIIDYLDNLASQWLSKSDTKLIAICEQIKQNLFVKPMLNYVLKFIECAVDLEWAMHNLQTGLEKLQSTNVEIAKLRGQADSVTKHAPNSFHFDRDLILTRISDLRKEKRVLAQELNLLRPHLLSIFPFDFFGIDSEEESIQISKKLKSCFKGFAYLTVDLSQVHAKYLRLFDFEEVAEGFSNSEIPEFEHYVRPQLTLQSVNLNRMPETDNLEMLLDEELILEQDFDSDRGQQTFDDLNGSPGNNMGNDVLPQNPQSHLPSIPESVKSLDRPFDLSPNQNSFSIPSQPITPFQK